jgi:hypothetical protein
MSNRERWVVYPLVLFSLLMHARDTFYEPTVAEFESVVCQELVVRRADGTRLVHIGPRSNNAGGIDLFDARGASMLALGVDELTPSGLIEIRGVRGQPLVMIGAGPRGGYLEAGDNRLERRIIVGHADRLPVDGLFAKNAAGELVPPNGNGQKTPWGVFLNGPPEVPPDAAPGETSPNDGGTNPQGNAAPNSPP